MVIGDRMFTQEQRGDDEATVCLDAATGEEIWAHVDQARFWDGQAGAGPRATPTFHDGQTVHLRRHRNARLPGRCQRQAALDARTWHDDCTAPLPMWGFSSSPLIVGDLVVVFAGGPDEQGLVAYNAGLGRAGLDGRDRPDQLQLGAIGHVDGKPQVLLFSDTGVVAVEPDDRQAAVELRRQPATASGAWCSRGKSATAGAGRFGGHRPHAAGQSRATASVEESRNNGPAAACARRTTILSSSTTWPTVSTRRMFCAIDLKTGKRLWKGRPLRLRPGAAAATAEVLFVLSEQGEVVLLAAQSEEVGRAGPLPGPRRQDLEPSGRRPRPAVRAQRHGNGGV